MEIIFLYIVHLNPTSYELYVVFFFFTPQYYNFICRINLWKPPWLCAHEAQRQTSVIYRINQHNHTYTYVKKMT